MSSIPSSRTSMSVLGVALAALLSSPAQAEPPSPLFGLEDTPYGASHQEWAARYWQWFFSLPAGAHPLFGSADCSAGQTGRVWFLGGAFETVDEGGQLYARATRDCTLPSSTVLFLPLIDAECSELEGNGATEEELRTCATGLGDFITQDSLLLEIDGQPVDVDLMTHRMQSPFFSFGPLPEDNLFGVPQWSGETSPSVSDGVYVMLRPLRVGSHTIHFEASLDPTSIGFSVFNVDVTYNLTVVHRRFYSLPSVPQ